MRVRACAFAYVCVRACARARARPSVRPRGRASAAVTCPGRSGRGTCWRRWGTWSSGVWTPGRGPGRRRSCCGSAAPRAQSPLLSPLSHLSSPPSRLSSLLSLYVRRSVGRSVELYIKPYIHIHLYIPSSPPIPSLAHSLALSRTRRSQHPPSHFVIPAAARRAFRLPHPTALPVPPPPSPPPPPSHRPAASVRQLVCAAGAPAPALAGCWLHGSSSRSPGYR